MLLFLLLSKSLSFENTWFVVVDLVIAVVKKSKVSKHFAVVVDVVIVMSKSLSFKTTGHFKK